MFELSRIPTTAQLRMLESAWIETCHKNWGAVLMEAAGLGATITALSMLSEIGDICVVCGRGNNGGDGLVVARHLQRKGLPVKVFMVSGRKEPAAESESGINKRILQDAVGLPIHFFDGDNIDELEDAVDASVLIIDALLGTGLDREVADEYADAIDIINTSGVPVLAIDIPSGINSDTGQIMGTAIEADATATFGYLKAGLLHYPGFQHAGLITLIDIGLPSINSLPPALHEQTAELEVPKWWLATHAHVREWLPERPADGHKGTFGKVVAVAGSTGMTGAAMLSSRSVLRAGAGYVVLCTIQPVVERLPAEEIVYRSLTPNKSNAPDISNLDEIVNDLKDADAILLGPGLGGAAATVKLVEALLEKIDKPCLVDADGLNAIAKLSTVKLKNADQYVFTPHPKELERLTGMPVAKIQSDRMAAARAAVEQFGCNIVLKGAHTVVATPNDGSYIIPTGNSGMATPGAGDVLSGIIAAFLAQGMPAAHAAIAGAYVHGAAGDVAADRLGEDGMVASDIMHAIPPVLAEIRDGEFEGRIIEEEVLSL